MLATPCTPGQWLGWKTRPAAQVAQRLELATFDQRLTTQLALIA
jgi:hypothetical protein